MQFWDTAGLERFSPFIPLYIKESHVVLIVFDITNSISFKSISKWIDDARQKTGEKCLIMIVGSKSDLDSERVLQHSLAHSKIASLGLTYMEVSAKTGNSIKELVLELGSKMVKDYKDNQVVLGIKNPSLSQPPVQQIPVPSVSLSASKGKQQRRIKKCDC